MKYLHLLIAFHYCLAKRGRVMKVVRRVQLLHGRGIIQHQTIAMPDLGIFPKRFPIGI